MEYQFHKWPRIHSVYRNHNPVVSTGIWNYINKIRSNAVISCPRIFTINAINMDKSATPKWLFFCFSTFTLKWTSRFDSMHVFFTIINYFSLSIYLSINGIGRFSTHGWWLFCPENHVAKVKVNFQNYIQCPKPPSKMAAISGHSFNIGPYGKYV